MQNSRGQPIRFIKIIWTITVALLFSLDADANCARPGPDEPKTTRSEWGLITSREEAHSLWLDLYESGRRLRNRAYWDKAKQSHVFPDGIKVQERFLFSLKQQIKAALDRQYAEHIFYPDLGHAHLFMPDAFSDLKLESALAHKDLVFLYHTAELYLLKPNGELSLDPWFQWRFYSRNLLGRNDEKSDVDILYGDDKFNTIRELPGHKRIATVYISTSKNGCFELQTATENLGLDISLNP